MQHRSEETHARILEAASLLFSKNGFDATGVAEICQAAGVSKGAFYHHFPTKQAVFMELMDSWLNGLDAGFQLMLSQTEDIPQALLQMAEMAGSLFESADVRLPIFLEFWTQASRDPAIWQATIEPYRRYQAYFSRLIQEGIAEGSLAPIDPALASRALVYMAMGMLMHVLFDPNSVTWSGEVKRSIEIMLYGMARRKA
ncbi:MAG TPA: TetR/AcrR family transcriptional regulator [Anaerolineales bacterium]|nr:TetR/AcrR family transcriptional regulator [Anaerolineales bacterium]